MAAPPLPTLLIQTAFIGDVILATALVEFLAQHEPGLPLDVLVRRGNEGLLAGNPHIRRVLIWDKKTQKYPNLLRLLQQIRQEQYGRVVTLQRFASTGFLTAFSGAAERVGFAENPFSRFFSRRVSHIIGDGTHEVVRNARLLGAEGVGTGSLKPRLYPTPTDEAAAAPYAAVGGYICLAPTSVWFTKQYPQEKWLELLAALPPQLPVYLLGGPPDAAACAQLAATASRPGLVNLSGQLSLLASAALMRGAVLNYVNDSAPMHLCSAVDAPVCAVFCSTVPAFGFGPLSSFSRIVEHPGPLACRPCGLHGHARCPLGHFRCAHEIDTAQLLAALAEAQAWHAQTARS
ncbi:glycosyltransferase family 9 protein [Hymenobacter sp. HMF4947]|uniref:Glycosyltransferase family 9 protein n=1 Tax=Hymenobacter ginkgonis TaxID=2682976 RepID=A0A7K1TGH7_9BACT|nr:glycosyltransferase family 9 protein [Hymenobacter ginkgonis]MVN77412.1 glycosyltransferase family 9 protein [Hymenobacter ginkgonis]